MGRFTRDVDDIERAIHHAVPVIVFDSLKLLALSTVALALYPGLLQVAVAVLVAAVVPLLAFARWLKRFAADSQIAHGRLMQRVVEAVSGMPVIRAYASEPHERARFDTAQNQYVVSVMKSLLIRSVHSPVMEVLGVAATVATIQISIGSAVSASQAVGFLLAIVLMYEPLKNLGRVSGALMPGLSAAQRVFDVIDRPPAVSESNSSVPWPTGAASVRFEHVRFRYGPREREVLRGFDLVLERGRIVGLTGPSGGGKSTVAALVSRLRDVTGGCVRIDGIDVRDLSLSALRTHVATVRQDTFLFNMTVRENIAYGMPTADAEAIQRAAHQARPTISLRPCPTGTRLSVVTGASGCPGGSASASRSPGPS